LEEERREKKRRRRRGEVGEEERLQGRGRSEK
jgi:hypothetical protein